MDFDKIYTSAIIRNSNYKNITLSSTILDFFLEETDRNQGSVHNGDIDNCHTSTFG